MARHGLILSQDEDAGLRKVFKYLPDLREAISRPKSADPLGSSGVCEMLCLLCPSCCPPRGAPEVTFRPPAPEQIRIIGVNGVNRLKSSVGVSE